MSMLLFIYIPIVCLGAYFLMMIGQLIGRHRRQTHRILLTSGLFLIPIVVAFGFLTGIGVTGVTIAPISISLAIILGVALLTVLFDWLKNRYQLGWTDYIYYIGIILTMYVSFMVGNESSYTERYFDIFNLTFFILFLIVACFIPVFLVSVCINLFTKRINRPIGLYRAPKLKRDILQHYREHGLSEQEIIYFRDQMGQAKGHIDAIEDQMSSVAKLRVIENRHNVVQVSQQFFKDIVEEPERMTQAGLFINRLLPSLDDLSSKYQEISQHVAKTKQTYMILDKTAITIDNLCQSILDQYHAFHQELYNDLDDEIQLANKSMGKHSDTETEDTSIVDELVQDPFDFDF